MTNPNYLTFIFKKFYLVIAFFYKGNKYILQFLIFLEKFFEKFFIDVSG